LDSCNTRTFTRRLGSELRGSSAERGSQSTASLPWWLPSTYSSPSQPFYVWLLDVIMLIMPYKSLFVKLRPVQIDVCSSGARLQRG
jgi:hypothetical protein